MYIKQGSRAAAAVICFKWRARGEGVCENLLVLGSGKEGDLNLYDQMVYVDIYCVPSTVGTSIMCPRLDPSQVIKSKTCLRFSTENFYVDFYDK